MKKLLLLAFGAVMAFGIDGATVFQKKCSSCHLGNVTKEQFFAQIKTVKAPPMIEISHRLRDTIQIKPHNENEEDIHRFAVIAYIKEYVKHPSFDYYMCDDRAINRFDVMPAQNLSEEELQAVAEWIYDYFEDKKF